MPQFSTLIGLNLRGSKDDPVQGFKWGCGPEIMLIFMFDWAIGEEGLITIDVGVVEVVGVTKVGIVGTGGGVVCITTWGGVLASIVGSI